MYARRPIDLPRYTAELDAEPAVGLPRYSAELDGLKAERTHGCRGRASPGAPGGAFRSWRSLRACRPMDGRKRARKRVPPARDLSRQPDYLTGL